MKAIGALRYAVILFVAHLAFMASPAAAAHFYVAIFGQQNNENSPSSSHSYATFVQTDDTAERRVLYMHTISWLPEDPCGLPYEQPGARC